MKDGRAALFGKLESKTMTEMKNKFLLYILLCPTFLFMSCSKTEWKLTEEGYYFYGKTKPALTYSWTGDTLGGLINGKGTLIAYRKNRTIVSQSSFMALYGTADVNLYSDSRHGKYLGHGKEKKGYKRPKDFGVLIVDREYPEDAEAQNIFRINNEWLKSHQTIYIGNFHKGLFSGYGKLYNKGLLEYEGYWKKGEKSSAGKEYKDGTLIYSGYFKRGKRDGIGEEYFKSDISDTLYLKYSGEWSKGKYDGFGKLYNEHILVYEGNWDKGLYNGKGILYENGQRIDGRWEDGLNADIYNKSIIEQALTYFGQENVEETPEYSNLQLAETDSEFISGLHDELNEKIANTISSNVDKRFGFWNVLRMFYQWIFTSDIKRAKKAETAFVKNLEPEEMMKEINAKIDYYNRTNNADLAYIKNIDEIPKLSIVDTDVAFKVLEREAMDATDGIIGILIGLFFDLILFIVTLFIPIIHPLIKLILFCISLALGLVILFIYGGPVMLELESEIKQMVIYNFQAYIDSQNIIQQIIS